MNIVFRALSYFALLLFLFSRQCWNMVLGRCCHTQLPQDSCPNSDNNIVFRMTRHELSLEHFHLQGSFSVSIFPSDREASHTRQEPFFLLLCLCTFIFQYWRKTHITYPKPFQKVQFIGIQNIRPAAKPSSLSIDKLKAHAFPFRKILMYWTVSWGQHGCPLHLHTLINIPKMLRESEVDGIPHTSFPSFLSETHLKGSTWVSL